MADKLNVNVGDKVIINDRFSERIANVEKITPTGRICVEGMYFDKHGWKIGGDSWSRTYIDYATKEEIDRILQKQTINKAYQLMRNNYKLNNLNFEQATKIIEILENKEK